MFFFIKLFEVGRPTFNLDLLRWEDVTLIQILLRWKSPPLIWATPSAGSIYKGQGKRKLTLFACWLSLSLASPFLHYPTFIGISAYFRILLYTEDQLSDPIL